MNSEVFEIYKTPDLLLPELTSLGCCKTDYHRLGGIRADGVIALELNYLQTGRIEWLTEDGLDEAGPGSLIVDQPGDWQGGANAIIHPCERFWIRFNFPPMGQLPGLRDSTLAELAEIFRTMRTRHFPASPQIKMHFDQLLAQQRSPGNFAEDVSRAAFHQILFQTEADYHNDQRVSYSPVISKALHYLEERVAEDPRVEDMAQHVGLSVGYFHESFVREMGVSPAQYQMSRRIAVARSLLIHTDDPVTEISGTLGFSSSQYFSTAFKKLVGITPRDYRLIRSRPLSDS